MAQVHSVSAAVSSVLTPVDPSEHIRRRRKIAQRKRRLRRASAGLILVGLAAGFAFSARKIAHHSPALAAPAKSEKHTTATHILPTPPHEIRCIHVTMSLANAPRRYRQSLHL